MAYGGIILSALRKLTHEGERNEEDFKTRFNHNRDYLPGGVLRLVGRVQKEQHRR